MEDGINEIYINLYPRPVTIEGTKKILHQMENNICKIFLKNGGIGTGFFVKISYNNDIIPVMITNHHILDQEYLKENKEIQITLNDNNTTRTINLNEKRTMYFSQEYDTTIIEIIPEKDKIYDFMELDDDIFKKDYSNILYNNLSIYIIHFPNAGKASVSYAIMQKMDQKQNIIHFCCTDKGSSGSPIINLLNNKIIGIHKQASLRFKRNYGTCLKNPINEFINQHLKNNKIINKDYLMSNDQIKKAFNKENKKTKDNHKIKINIFNETISHIFILCFISIFKTLLLI
jgi:hypothetical protein